MNKFELNHDNGKLIAVIEIDGVVYEKDVTEYFSSKNAHDDWLDHRLGI